MLKISRESEINLINILIDQDIISGKDLVDIKKASSEGEKSQIEAVFELKLTDEQKILDLLVNEQSLDIIDLSTIEITEEIKSILEEDISNALINDLLANKPSLAASLCLEHTFFLDPSFKLDSISLRI